MAYSIKKVAVMGTGVMGSQIAAHLANAGIPSLAFDISQEVAEKGIQMAASIKPAAFYDPKFIQRIQPCNYDDHLHLLKEVDWVIEAVVERLDIKRALFERMLPHLRPGNIVTSNTSGISIQEMIQGFPESFRQHFMVTHFFNPPRYMHLLELVSGDDTLPEVLQTLVTFGENVLGKGIVYAKDTPNFIANRIGVYGMMLTLRLAREMGLTVDEVDALTGTLIGRPKSATFRTADVVGLDTLAHVANTAYQKCTTDEAREVFQIPDFLQQMIERKWLGQKSGQGFYKKEGKEILALNLDTLEYEPRKKVAFDSVQQFKRLPRTEDRLRSLAFASDKAGKFIWEVLANTLIYAANRIPEIADDVLNIDNAMKWGFGWEFGPFETWDILGVEQTVQRMEEEGKAVPEWVRTMLQKGQRSFYTIQEGKLIFYDPLKQTPTPAPDNPRVIRLKVEKSRRPIIAENGSATLLELGDGVLMVELHSKYQPNMNPIDDEMLALIGQALRIIPQKGYRGLVIGTQAQNFSVGANLAMILELIKQQAWEKVEALSKTFQDLGQALKYAPFPVVSAPFNMTLGGGFEISAAADRMVACAELYVGAVEVGVGLIPGAGGTLRILLNFIRMMQPMRSGPFPPVQKAFETIAYAKVSSSAAEAIKMGYLTPEDSIVINPDHLIYEAKQLVLKLAEGYTPPEPQKEIYLPGEGGRLVIEASLDDMRKRGLISDYDRFIGQKLAYVLTGGDKASPTNPVDEQYLLDLEREAFVTLCQQPKTQERIVHMLKTGKPLRN
ncbi:MAG: 3-hydroxyacyl-CoA dehydrogenase [Calditrichaeota bacterium]|nr:3-hydroxyacyl-CoA dehydrogenase [Calditrichota bacterium]